MGPDNLPNWILKEFSPILAAPLAAIINSSLRDGNVPLLWKSADVLPLPKVSPPKDMSKDLRPISLTPVLSKCAEYHVREMIMATIMEDLDPHQFGSIKGSSTVLALLELYHLWITALDTLGNAVRILLIDYRKAFDRVQHSILLSKLANTGLPNCIIKWMTSFLLERKQRVKVGQTKSDWATINAGVPQGTLLGPPAFILHINDLQTSVNACKYVDDTTLWEICKTNKQGSKLQQAMNEVLDWSHQNEMQLNCQKTKEMLVYMGNKTCEIPPVVVDNCTIERVDSCKLLGITLSSDLTWGKHVEQICKKASQRIYMLCLLRRAGLAPKDLVQFYKSIIRPLLEYSCEVWNCGLTVGQCSQIEAIQKRSLKIVYPELAYEEAINIADLETLATRRDRQCRKLFAKILKPGHKLHYLMPAKRTVCYNLRRTEPFPRTKVRCKRTMNSLLIYGLYNYQ